MKLHFNLIWIALQYLFDSVMDISVLPCGHTMHQICLEQMHMHSQYCSNALNLILRMLISYCFPSCSLKYLRRNVVFLKDDVFSCVMQILLSYMFEVDLRHVDNLGATGPGSIFNSNA